MRVCLSGTRVYCCASCKVHLANSEDVISKNFVSTSGKAYLFRTVVNATIGAPENRALNTGPHTVSDISCRFCKIYLGWAYLDTTLESQKYKLGKFILERAQIEVAETGASRSDDWMHAANAETERPCFCPCSGRFLPSPADGHNMQAVANVAHWMRHHVSISHTDEAASRAVLSRLSPATVAAIEKDLMESFERKALPVAQPPAITLPRASFMRNSPSLLELPFELPVHIFSFLDVRSITAAAAACRTLREVAHDSSVWYKRVVHDGAFLRHPDLWPVEAIAVKRLWWNDDSLKLPHLRSLSISGVPKEELAVIEKWHMPNLETLDLECPVPRQGGVRLGNSLVPLATPSKLRTLRLPRDALPATRAPPLCQDHPSLAELELASMDLDTPGGIDQLPGDLRALVLLRQDVSREQAEALVARCPNLRSVVARSGPVRLPAHDGSPLLCRKWECSIL